MTEVVYHVVEHDGGFAYTYKGVFSETYPTREAAQTAAQIAAAEQRVPGKTEPIQYQDSKGKWHEETAQGSDRPETTVDAKG